MKKRVKRSSQHSRLVEMPGAEPAWMSPEELLALFRPGDIVEKTEGHDPLLPLHIGISSVGRAPAGWPAKAKSSLSYRFGSDWRVEGSVPKCWLVLNVSWEPDLCHLWIELISMDGSLRGWLKDPQDHVRKAL